MSVHIVAFMNFTFFQLITTHNLPTWDVDHSYNFSISLAPTKCRKLGAYRVHLIPIVGNLHNIYLQNISLIYITKCLISFNSSRIYTSLYIEFLLLKIMTLRLLGRRINWTTIHINWDGHSCLTKEIDN